MTVNRAPIQCFISIPGKNDGGGYQMVTAGVKLTRTQKKKQDNGSPQPGYVGAALWQCPLLRGAIMSKNEMLESRPTTKLPVLLDTRSEKHRGTPGEFIFGR
jgi:hypothetical protein